VSPTRPKVAIDFGCGWGRITRFFIKDFEKAGLVSIAPLDESIEICEATNPWATFKKIDLSPPVDMASSSVDLIFAFRYFRTSPKTFICSGSRSSDGYLAPEARW
jgi:trans-aconitate methyltransferase